MLPFLLSLHDPHRFPREPGRQAGSAHHRITQALVMIALLTPLMAVLGPLAVLLLMGVLFAETGLLAGFFLPGDSLLFAAGVLVAAGAIHLPLGIVAAGAFLAAVAGDQVGYLVGR